MKIKKIRLKNYRNYDNLEIDFNDNLNIIIGNNAQGKTNLLESIYVLAVTKSFLSINDKNLINFANKYAILDGELECNKGLINLQILVNDTGKKVRINKKEIKKLSEYISLMNVIVFSADNIIIFKNSPNSRRKYFNIQISQINKKYLKILTDYNLVLRQRNEFLKFINLNKESDIKYFDVLNDKYVDLSISLCKYRLEFTNEINKYLGDLFLSITGIRGLKLVYNSNIDIYDDDIKINFTSNLKKNLNREIQYKMTLFGPNRDDFYFSLNGKNLSMFGSQGQLRSAVLALKLAEVKLFSDVTKDYPILLLDDIFSELDIVKRNNVLKYLEDNIQTIITTTDIDNIDEKIRKKANVYEIDNGKIISREIICEQEGDINE